MNVLTFTGNIGTGVDELRYTPKGDAVAQFSVALSSGYGEKKHTSWLRCSIFGKRAESLAPYLVKGASVAITGELAIRTYQNKQGEEKTSAEVRVNDLTLTGSRNHHVDDSNTQTSHRDSGAIPSNSRPTSSIDDLDDDIPF